MRTADDARSDPKPGDVFRRDFRQRAIVGRVEDTVAISETVGYSFRGHLYLTDDEIRKWAATAEVLKVAQ